MARPDETGASYISKLNVNNATYTIKDAWSRAAIDEIEQAIAGGVVFRGVSETAIADGDSKKNITLIDGTTVIAATDQKDGDLFIYNNGTKNLEFIVTNGKYSEFGSTGELGSLAFANQAAGSVEVPLQASITAEDYTPQVDKGTLAVTTSTGSVGGTATAATIGTTATDATLGTTTAAATIDTTETAASVTYTATGVTVGTTATGVTAAGPSVSLTYTTGTFTALQDVTYDGTTATLSISSVTSDAFTKVPTVESVGNIAITYDKATTVTYDKTTAVTYDKASGTFLSTASLTGDLAVTAAAPTLTITNPTITVTVSPVSGS